MERTNRNRLTAITLVLAIVMIALVGVVATVGINSPTQIATAGYELTPSECTHNLIKIANVETNVTAVPINNANDSNIGVDSAWKNDDIVEGSTGVRFKFFYSGKSAKVTLTADLPEARTIDIYWQTGLGNPYAYGAVTITHNDEERVIDFRHGANESWNIDHIQCDAGFNTFTYAFVSESYSWGDPDGRWFQVMPEYIPTFDEIDRCTQCGLTCSHATSSMGYDDDEHYYVCHDICKKRFAATEDEHSLDSNGDCLYCGYTRMEKDEEGYYLIGNPRQLAVFTKYVNVDGHTAIKGRLTADIDLNGQKFDPIGTPARMFIGEFDGQNHRIYNVNLNLEETDCVGFFGIAGSNNSGSAYIHNLTIDRSCSFRGKKYVGGLIGAVSGEILIKYCGNEANATVINLTMKDATAGGIIGHGGVATIQYCYNTGNVTGGSECWNEYYYGSGGITGKMDGFTIEHSYNSGTVNTTLCGGGSNSNTGHRFNTFANSFGDQSVVADCYNYEAVEDAHFTATQYTSLTDGSMLALLNVGAKTPFVQSATHPIFVAARQLGEEAGCTHEYVVAKYEWADNHSSCKGIAICKNCGKVLAEEKSSNSSTVMVPTDPGLLQTTYTVEFYNKDVFQPQKTTIVYAMSTIYTVTLHANGGTGTPCTFYYKGVGTTLPTDYLKDGKYIEGWYDNSGLTGSKVTEIPSNATGNKDFYAKYENHTCTLEDYEGQAATCTVAGRTAGKRCTTCGFIREGGDVIRPLGHDYHYSASGASLTATCSRCPETATITLVRNGSDVSIDDTTAWQEHGFAIPEILYIGIDSTVYEESSIAPTADGDYRARIKKSGQEAELTFAISGGAAYDCDPDTVDFVVPVGKNLVYSGAPQALVTSDTIYGGTLQYKLDDGEWGTTVPTAINAGNYTVSYRVIEDGTGDVIRSSSVAVSIAKIDLKVTVTKVPRMSKGGKFPSVSKSNVGLAGSDASNVAFLRAFRENIVPDYSQIDKNQPGEYSFELMVKDGFVFDNYNIILVPNSLKLVIGDVVKDNKTGVTIDGIYPVTDGGYTPEIAPVDPSDDPRNPYINENDEAVIIVVNKPNPNGGNGEVYHGDGTITMPIPGGVDPDPDKHVVYVIDPDTHQRTPLDPNEDYYYDEETGNIVIPNLPLPQIIAFNNVNGQIVFTVQDVTINEGDALPTFNVTVTGYKGGSSSDSIEQSVFDQARAMISNPTTNYVGGRGGVFEITLSFAGNNNEYSIDGYRIILKNGKLNVRSSVIADSRNTDDVQVSIEGADGDDAFFDVNITVQVEVKTDVKSEASKADYSAIEETNLEANESITAVYDVKLVRTTTDENGNEVEEEIQPSDIKPGTIIAVKMAIPVELQGKSFRILHIHAENDVEFVDYTVEGNFIIVRVNRLSQFAFVVAESSSNQGLSGGAIAGIVIGCIFGLLLLAFIILFLLFKRDKDKDDDKKLIKVPFINNVMGKTDAFATSTVNKCKDLLSKKKSNPADEPKADQTDEPEE